MDQNLIEKVKLSISNIESKKFRIYFFVQDTKGNAKASLSYIYRMAMSLKTAGYNPIMLHEKPDYIKVGEWLGSEFDELEHQSVEGQNLAIAPEDILVIPEIFGYVMEQVSNLPCGKIVLCQAYDHVFETLSPGATWDQYGFLKCVITSENMKNHMDDIMKNISYSIIEPAISKHFVKDKYPAKPIVAVHSREQRDGLNFIKQFYLKFPQFRWVTFRDMRGMSEEQMANTLKDCFVSVWIDPTSSFGTYPLESMKMGVPVIGKTPNLKHEWMKQENGVWVENQLDMTNVLANYLQNWLEDNINSELYTSGIETAETFGNYEKFSNEVVTLFSDFANKRKDVFTQQLNNQ